MSGEIKFRLAGGAQPLILVPTHVNGSGPYEFILDTGAGTSLLSPEVAQSLGLTQTESKEGAGAGGKVTVALSRVESLAIGESQIKDLQVAITDEIHRIGAAVGAKIDGDVGYNYLKNFRVAIDYRRYLLRLTQAGQESGNAGVPTARASLKFEIAHPAKPLIMLPVKVNGTGPYRFALDTGTSTTVISPELAHSLGIKSMDVPEMTGAGGKIQAAVGMIESLAVEAAQLQNLHVMVAGFLGMLSQMTGTKLDGIIGYNYLKEYRVTIDYPNEILYLE